ncbi:hypothetical protein HK101_003970, partial [Irineochytrium annulatum]
MIFTLLTPSLVALAVVRPVIAGGAAPLPTYDVITSTGSLVYQFPDVIHTGPEEASIPVNATLNFIIPLSSTDGINTEHVHDVVGSATRTSCVKGGPLPNLDSRYTPPVIARRQGFTFTFPPAPTQTTYAYAFNTPGTYYFYSPNGRECALGMNAAVTVTSPPTPVSTTATSTTAAPPATTTVAAPTVCDDVPNGVWVCDGFANRTRCMRHLPGEVIQCPVGDQCFQGACVANVCANQGNGTVCVGNGVAACVNGTIASETACPTGDTCADGIC